MSDPARGVPRGRRVVLPGRGTTVIRDVAGPPGAPTVVLLHGLGATASINWPGAFDELAPWFRVVALDQAGHGRGVRSRWPFRLEDCADDVVRLADVLGIERVITVGYSMGGPVALFARRRHPARVSGLVLCATAARFADSDARPSALEGALAASLPVDAAGGAPRREPDDAAPRHARLGGAAGAARGDPRPRPGGARRGDAGAGPLRRPAVALRVALPDGERDHGARPPRATLPAARARRRDWGPGRPDRRRPPRRRRRSGPVPACPRVRPAGTSPQPSTWVPPADRGE